MNEQEPEYDVVVDALEQYRDKLIKMNQSNANIGMFSIMDQIRYEHIDTLNKAIEERRKQ
jgi:uncharacterized metal-binding protein